VTGANEQGHASGAHDEALAVARALYAALMEARAYVFGRTLPPGHAERDWRSETAAGVLERVDGALADAGELLQGTMP